MGRKQYTDDKLLEDLRRLAEEYENPPSTGLIAEEAIASAYTYGNRFGSIPKAREKAGLNAKSGHEIRGDYVKVSDEELLNDLKRLAGVLGRPPSTTEVDELGEYCNGTYRDRFGSIADAREKAGLARNYEFTSEKVSKEKVYRECVQCGKGEWVLPSRANQKHCSMECRSKTQRKYTADEVRKKLKTLANCLGRSPTTAEFREAYDISHGVFEDYEGLDSYSEELRNLGLQPNCAQDLDKDDLLNDLKRIGSEIEGVPCAEDVRRHGKCNSVGPYVRVFGSFTQALEHAGFDIPGAQRREISEQELVEDYRKVADELGEVPSYTDIENHSSYSPTTYENTFGTFLLAKKAAGYPPEPSRHNLPTGEDHYAWQGGVGPTYGSNWPDQRNKARERDEYICQRCGIGKEEHIERYGTLPHVHHIRPWHEFESEEKRNALSNLVTLCASCHKKIENLPVIPEFDAVVI